MVKKILIVDDSRIARKMIKACIPQEQNFDILEAGDGKAGLEKFKESNPDITFLDLTMPVMGGIECLEEIKKVYPDAIVIVVTADIQSQVLTKVKNLGASMVLKKPITKELMINILSQTDKIK